MEGFIGTKIQTEWRGYIGTKIQTEWRGYIGRMELYRNKNTN